MPLRVPKQNKTMTYQRDTVKHNIIKYMKIQVISAHIKNVLPNHMTIKKGKNKWQLHDKKQYSLHTNIPSINIRKNKERHSTQSRTTFLGRGNILMV